MKTRTFFLSFFLGLLVCCNGGSFKGTDQVQKKPTNTNNANPNNPSNGLPADSGQNSEGINNEQISQLNGGNDNCPTIIQKVLVLDFKSGWWSGDGGDFFTKAIGDLQGPCQSKIEMKYFHIIVGGSILNIGSLSTGSQEVLKTDFNQFSQIWVLSGAYNDPLDYTPDSPILKQIIEKIKSSKKPLLIGAGYGSILTANAVTESIGLGKIFATNLTQGLLLDPMSGVSIVTRLNLNDKLQNHALFSRGMTSLPDHMKVGYDPVAKGDYLLGTNGLSVIGTNTEGQGCIGVYFNNAYNPKIVFDSGIQRFYAIWHTVNDKDTLIYMQNIIKFLAD